MIFHQERRQTGLASHVELSGAVIWRRRALATGALAERVKRKLRAASRRRY